ncbi:RidA family protein [Acetanaerobacterium sp. MSJ-12]|uniref:RidA family protein n=1 Tax=Bittarella massiliensis (ex Durand et al. 2017) TaxID=1720313 RepID=A0AAW5K6G4_9FIRM|nr:MULTISPECIES: RidA family protein [Oscillospiraceae]MBC2870904.1 RidA family protein [Bittarella massiliensis (ex Durand et al. 2017)]MBU5418587.1 RidA family protein [Acetanaerobacterium sp. MSJ-12]MCQ4948596.1 RidA family protein [Bittarella massiliensis (ex Durand et al. 2017)]
MERKTVLTEQAPAPIGPYVQAVMAGESLYISGQLGIDMQTGEMPAGVAEQAECSLKNLCAILAAEGMSTANLVKTTIFLTDMGNFAAVNEVYAKYFDGAFPARSCVAVAALPKGGLVEIEAVAVRG